MVALSRGGLPRVSPATLVGLALFGAFVLPSVFRSPLGLQRISVSTHDPAERVVTGSYVSVPPNSHAYLRSKFSGGPEEFVANVSRTYETIAFQDAEKIRNTPSYLSEFIERDLSHWDASGITPEMILAAENSYDECDGDMFRFQIVGGKLYVYHITQRGGGWYPAVLGPGNLAARGRVPYTLLVLLQVLRLFPGQIPDLDAVMHVGDFTCTNATAARLAGRVPLPMFGASTSDASADVPFPDFSYFGHEHRYLMDPYGNVIFGWDLQRQLLEAKYARVPLAHRVPRAMWRGRTRDKLYPMRDRLRRAIAACPQALARRDEADGEAGNGTAASPLPSDAALFDLTGRPQVLGDFGDFRYLLHIEPQAWASNVRQKLASGSVVIQPGLDYYEWYTRALRPGIDFVVLDPDAPGADVCAQLAAVLRDMNALVDREARVGADQVAKETNARAETGRRRDAQEAETKAPGAEGGSGEAAAASASSSGGGRAVAEDGPAKGGRRLLQDAPAESSKSSESSSSSSSSSSPFSPPTALPTLTSPYSTLGDFSLTSPPASSKPSYSAAAFTSTPTLEAERASTLADPATAGLLSGTLDVAPGAAGTPRAKALEALAAGASAAAPSLPSAPFRWGSSLLPWEIAANGAAFAKEKMREIDALVYARDVLKAYAKRQRFVPEVNEKSECYDGEKVLQQFGFPHQEDRDVVAKAYPWLEHYTGGCPER